MVAIKSQRSRTEIQFGELPGGCGRCYCRSRTMTWMEQTEERLETVNGDMSQGRLGKGRQKGFFSLSTDSDRRDPSEGYAFIINCINFLHLS